MADTTRRSPHFTLWQRNIKNVKNKSFRGGGAPGEEKKGKENEEEEEEEEEVWENVSQSQKNLSSMRKCGRVTSSGLMKTEMDFPGFSVTSC